jgi:hypothetical protein
MMGRRNDAETMLRRIEALAHELGLFSEQATAARGWCSATSDDLFTCGICARGAATLRPLAVRRLIFGMPFVSRAASGTASG